MRFIASIIFVAITSFCFAQEYPSKPKLIVHITIEQMRYDYISRFANNFGKSGFLKILEEGTSCTNTQVNSNFPQSSPSFTNISTGAVPANHGIIGDNWFNRLYNTKTNAVIDNQYVCVGCSKSARYQVSPKNMFASTFSEELVKSSLQKSKVYSVALKPHAAVLMGGRLSNGTYFMDDITGNWVTSSYYADSLPDWVNEFNNKRFADIYIKKTWNTFKLISRYEESLDDKTKFEIGIKNQITFPYKLKKLADSYSTYDILNTTPYGNTYTKDMAIELIDREKLGKDEFTDYISIAFTATEEIGNNFGSLSKEIQDTYTRLDFEIGFLIEYLENTIGKNNFLLIISSNHGVETPVKYNLQQGLSGGIFKHVEAMYILDKYLDATYKEGDWVQYYNAQQVYLNNDLISSLHIPIETIQNICATFLKQLSGVQNVITASAMDKGVFNDPLKVKLDNSYNSIRSGDLFIELLPNWSQQSMDVVGQHLSPYTEVSHVPLIWYGWKTQHKEINTPIYTTQIVSTLCEILNIQRPNMSFDSIIEGIFIK